MNICLEGLMAGRQGGRWKMWILIIKNFSAGLTIHISFCLISWSVQCCYSVTNAFSAVFTQVEHAKDFGSHRFSCVHMYTKVHTHSMHNYVCTYIYTVIMYVNICVYVTIVIIFTYIL